MPDLTPDRFDRVVRLRSAGNPAGLLWGAKSIARHIGRSTDFVTETLAKEPGSPVKKIGRQYCVKLDALDEYFGNRLNKPA
jgi:hypothetical protein